jgi:peroxiredoxin
LNIARILALFIGAAATSALGCGGQDAPPKGPGQTPAAALTTGTRARDFSARDIDGKSVTLSNHLGKQVVLLDFISTWCEPCVAEFPHLRSLYHANKAKGFVVLAISVDGPETVANVPSFARRNMLEFPVIIDGDSQIALLYNPKKTAPVTVLIDRTGTVVSIREGYTAGDERGLAQAIAQALENPHPQARPRAMR